MPEEGDAPTSPLESTPLRFSTLPASMHVDKSENIRHYLASLPNLLVDDDQGIGGENICTSESGSGYSSPILTPPEEEQFHTLYRLAKEVHQDMRERLAHEDLESSSPTEDEKATENPPVPATARVPPVITTTSIDANAATTVITTQPLLPTGVENPCPMDQPREVESDLAGRSSKDPSASPPPVTFTVGSSERSQPEASGPHRPLKTRSASLPHNTLVTAVHPSKKPSLSPNSSVTGLSSLPRNGSSLQQLLEENTAPADGRVSLPSSEGLPTGDQDVVQFDSRSDSPIDVSVPLHERLQQHRRTKSDTCEVTGPVKTAQINSVPERIKEIEERNVCATKVQSQLEQDPDRPREPPPPPASKYSPNPPVRCPSMSSGKFSSSESLPSDDDELRQEQCLPFKFSPSLRRTTRHSSLSPKPPSSRSLPPQLVFQSSLSLPHNVQPPDIESDSMSMCSETKYDENIAITLQGAVRARVQDFEGMGKEEGGRQADAQKSSVENLLRRFSPPNQRRPSSDVVVKRPASNMELKQLRTSPERPEHVFKKPSEIIRRRRRPSCDVMANRPRSVMADSGVSTLESSSGKFMSVEDIPSQLASVRELKRKFEDTQSVDSGERSASRFKVNLRRAQSLRDFEGLRTRRPRGKQVSSPRLHKRPPNRRSSEATCQPSYITTIPTMTHPKEEVVDFETTLSKFSTMARGQLN